MPEIQLAMLNENLKVFRLNHTRVCAAAVLALTTNLRERKLSLMQFPPLRKDQIIMIYDIAQI